MIWYIIIAILVAFSAAVWFYYRNPAVYGGDAAIGSILVGAFWPATLPLAILVLIMMNAGKLAQKAAAKIKENGY